MQRLIENYINGNLSDAKRQAKRFAMTGIRKAFLDHGYTLHAAVAITDFLKGHGSFQAACDAEHASK